MQDTITSAPSGLSSVEVSKVLRNTYALLAMTILFSAITAGIGMALGLSHMVGIVCSLAAIGILWLVLPKTANSSKGVGVVFLFTGLLGLGLAPTLNYYLAAYANGGAIIMQALGGTAFVFFGLSAYVLTTKKDFSFMGGFLTIGLLTIILASLAFFVLGFFGIHISGAMIALNAGIVFLFSGFILYDTSRIINGGETNYIYATVSLYLDILNLFTGLLHLLGALGGDD